MKVFLDSKIDSFADKYECYSFYHHLQKFSDNSALVGLIRDDGAYTDFVDWYQQNHLQLGARKTKELVVDFCRYRQPCTQVNRQGTDSW